MSLLAENIIKQELEVLIYWEVSGLCIIRECVASNFASAVGLINSIAIIAEKLDHHPDILIYGWNKIRITLTTHQEGGLTEKDFKLAKLIEQILN